MIPPRRFTFLTVCCSFVLASFALPAFPSSHREAPAIAQDPMADNTDVYAFISPTDPDNVVLVANSIPLMVPFSGPNFYSFADDVAYEICIDNDGDAFRDLCYRYDFETTIQNGATFLYNTGEVTSLTDPDLNVRQNYDLTRVDYTGGPTDYQTSESSIMTGAPVAPWYSGIRSFPNFVYDSVAQEAVTTNGTTTSFAGPRDEPFFIDLTIFDLLSLGNNLPTTQGSNVMTIAIEVPIEDIVAGGVRPAASETGPTSVIGVYARNLRRLVEIRRRSGPKTSFGRFVQVSRLAVPLVNEVVIPLQDKDNFNRTSPHDDVVNFGSYILDPELNGLLSSILGLACPPTPPGGRTDFIDLLSPNGTQAADLLRLDVTEGQTFADSGFPNGRRLEDDVVDTMLSMICSADQSIPVGDGVFANEFPFNSFFPYVHPPNTGNPFP